MSAGTLLVPRAEFTIDDPWKTPRACETVRLRLATSGTAPRLATTVATYYDDEFLTVVFSAADDHIVATLTDRDAPLYQEDVVEVFLAPCTPRSYFEFEVSPAASIFDAAVESPDGDRATMHVDRRWNAPGLIAAVRKIYQRNGEMSVDTVIRIPFAAVSAGPPAAGARWLANFFRIDRHAGGDEFSAWQPTLRVPPDFHVPSAFGVIAFI